ncbi:PEPxxWA-CTERM sorting domain-containing protein [Sphingomonas sp. ID1715]|uniref:PEPxxWA-CTERM sorting domain-containing protein n=1 Tax=Sphingomonas sp. ID1715 TaxID=1656898 RepID=UPI0020C28D67|nr:PEPxxWA-CTERM sorting domain-containing protein [Sphingomonas sp. ID1715]
MKRLILASAIGMAAFAAAPSQAADIVTDCVLLGIDDIVPNAEKCVGYYDKNVLKASAGDFAKQEEVDALKLLGLGDGTLGVIKVLEKLDNSGNFVRPLNGLTYIGVHYGAGNGPVANNGGVTAFYRFNAGANLDAISFQNGSVSGVALYATGAAVPEPAAWALMLGGFGLLGASMRRRQRTTVTFA